MTIARAVVGLLLAAGLATGADPPVEKLTVNHRLAQAGDRGTNVHNALERWAESGGEFFPTPAEFPDEERPYVEALLAWVDALDGAAKVAQSEVMVGSVEYGFAGRFDFLMERAVRYLDDRAAHVVLLDR